MKEPKSISFPSDFLDLLDAFTDNRSAVCVSGAKKEMVMKAKAGDLFRLLKESMGMEISGPGDLEEVTVRIPRAMIPVFERHCWDCQYSMDDFFRLAAVKFWLMKEAPEEFWEKAIRYGRDGINPFGSIVR